ncbi:hypothetical protein CERZMDRAFT_99362 [Cercospora zeae-maydis SCOH1-5]|uniref:DUF7730 domain-containing protein n=1 Tax=Cercospora zeae-maydis SCOH1-5 TaxID=717836 RepID=A0A6A6FBE7_9PEZI|nr:hypothetical protein CERZMDRAFT_99362 [Cercospora zeae-maydis SCOH1-5]
MANIYQTQSRGGYLRCGRQERPQKTYLELLPCGLHYIERFADKHGFVEDVKSPYRRRLEKGEKRGECICDYYNFPRLLHERESLPDQYKSLPTSKINFLHLPPEVRNQIYEEALLFNRPIEFCPEPFRYVGWLYRGHSYRLSGQGHVIKCDHERAIGYQLQYIRDKMWPMTALMRINKQIHEETSTIFYGQNVFAFSSVVGWVYLDFFLHQIGLNKCAMLRKLIVCHPSFCQLPKSNLGEQQFALAGNLIHPRQTHAPGFVYGKRWWDGDHALTKDPVLILNKIGKLEKLGLVIPIEVVPFWDCPLSMPFDVTRFENLHTSLFLLQHQSPDNAQNLSPAWTFDTVVAEIRAAVKPSNFQLLSTKVHAQGRYATGWIAKYADELVEMENEESKILAKERADREADLLETDLRRALKCALPPIDLEGL